jgi:hypothetical protein
MDRGCGGRGGVVNLLLGHTDLENKPLRVCRLAQQICLAAFGDWKATGYEIRVVCIQAAEAALLTLDQAGYDLTMLDASEHKP